VKKIDLSGAEGSGHTKKEDGGPGKLGPKTAKGTCKKRDGQTEKESTKKRISEMGNGGSSSRLYIEEGCLGKREREKPGELKRGGELHKGGRGRGGDGLGVRPSWEARTKRRRGQQPVGNLSVHGNY